MTYVIRHPMTPRHPVFAFAHTARDWHMVHISGEEAPCLWKHNRALQWRACQAHWGRHAISLQIAALSIAVQYTATLQHCNTLATLLHCNTATLQHCNTATLQYCNTLAALQRTATHCNTLQHTATHYNTLQFTSTVKSTIAPGSSIVHGHISYSRSSCCVYNYQVDETRTAAAWKVAAVSTNVEREFTIAPGSARPKIVNGSLSPNIKQAKRTRQWIVDKWQQCPHMESARLHYGVALVSRIDKITGLFCKRAL